MKKLTIRGKFISTVSLITCLGVVAMSLLTIRTFNQTQSSQVEAFVESIKFEQMNEEKLLKQLLVSKGESIAAMLAQTSTNVTMVATAAEQMTATVNEIAQNSEKARSMTGMAVSEALSASESVNVGVLPRT
jgi:methyl-accepting chemotaxis protein